MLPNGLCRLIPMKTTIELRGAKVSAKQKKKEMKPSTLTLELHSINPVM
jgi:hypothetical protein